MLNYLNGVKNTNMNGLLDKFTTLKNNAIQQLPPVIKKAVDAGGAVASVGVKISLIAVRASFLAIVRVNFLHVAENLELAIRKDRNKVKNWWQDFGGNFDELLNITNLGIKAGESGKASKLTGSLGADPASAAAVTATPITSSFVILLKSLAVTAVTAGVTALTKGITSSADELVDKGKKGLTDALNNGTLPSGASGTVIIAPPGANPLQPVTPTPIEPTTATEKKSNMPLIIGGIAVLGIGAFFLLKKKK
jgi:LPXTG-motif cell wall-anchored protein